MPENGDHRISSHEDFTFSGGSGYKCKSLDFQPVINSYAISSLEKSFQIDDDVSYGTASRRVIKKNYDAGALVLGYEHRTAVRWFVIAMVGCLTGLLSLFIVWCTDLIGEHRLRWLDSMGVWWDGSEGHESDDQESRFIEDWHWGAFLNENMWIFVKFALFNSVLATSASVMCLALAPGAAGSGIPETKSFLNGVRVRTFRNPVLLVVKTFGTILAVSSGLVIGPEGPLIHLGAILGSMVTRTHHIENAVRHFSLNYPFLSKILGCAPGSSESDYTYDENTDSAEMDALLNKKEASPIGCHNSFLTKFVSSMSHLRNDYERRDIIACGAAAGFAAAFGAPIGAVIFCMEEASTYFPVSMLFRCLLATSISTFIIALKSGNLSEFGVISLASGTTRLTETFIFSNSFAQMPLYAMVGICGGLLGASFNGNVKRIAVLRGKFFEKVTKKDHIASYKVLEVGILSLITSFVTFFLPLMTFVGSDEPNYNLGSVLFGSRDEAILDILSDPAKYGATNLLTLGIAFYLLETITFGVALPSGIFMPTVLIGSCLGGWAGIFLHGIFPSVSPDTFALLGAASYICGIQRNVVSLCVIFVEGTGETKILIPTIITLMFARYVGDLFNCGIYEIGIHLKHYPVLEPDCPPGYMIPTAANIMATPVACISSVDTVDNLVILLDNTKYEGFPVVDVESKKYVGLVRRDQLVAIIECGIFIDHPDLMQLTAKKSGRIKRTLVKQTLPIPDDQYDSFRLNKDLIKFDKNLWFYDHVNFNKDHSVVQVGGDATLPKCKSHVPKGRKVMRNRFGIITVSLDLQDFGKSVDVAAIADKGTYVIVETCPLIKAYKLFTTMALKYLVVLGGEGGGQVVGLITRHDLTDETIKRRTGFTH